MRNSFVKINKNDILFCGRSNSEIGIFVRYKAICDNFETDALTWKQICSNFTPKERKVVSKFFGIEQKNSEDETKNSKNEQKKSKVEQKNSKVEQKNSKIGLKKECKNKELNENPSRADIIYNNIYNTIPDQTRLDYKGGEPPEKKYTFEGEVIKLTQKDYDRWKLAYPDLNLYAELLVRDKYLAGLEPNDKARQNWFMSTAQYFVSRNTVRKAQNENLTLNDCPEESFEEYLERSV